MRLIWDPERLSPSVLVLGMFDGVHLGHQALLKKGRELADAKGVPLCVCTFEPHPMAVLCPDREPPRLETFAERAKRMALHGVDVLALMRFTRELAAQPPEAFVQRVIRMCRPTDIVVGYNFTFGDRGRGNGALLRELSGRYGYTAHIIPEVTDRGETVSSTHIRELLRAGHVARASQLLGYDHSIAGRVVDGKHIGRTLGFPTANLAFDRSKAIPCYGVYACMLDADGRSLPAVVNVGRHPTLPEGQMTIEAHVPGEEIDLYGRMVRLRFKRFLRPERTFDTVEQLREQIALDTREALAFLRETKS